MENQADDVEKLTAEQMADCARAAYKTAKREADDAATADAVTHWKSALIKALGAHDTIAVGNITVGIKGAIPEDTTQPLEKDFRDLAVAAYEQNLRSMQPGLPSTMGGQRSILARLRGDDERLQPSLGTVNAGTRLVKAVKGMRGQEAEGSLRRGPEGMGDMRHTG